MAKIKSLDELRKIREQSKSGTQLRITGENADRTVITVGMGTCGIAAGARPVMGALMDSIEENKLPDVSVIAAGCFGSCYAEPLVTVKSPGKEPVHYARANVELAKKIIERHVMKGEIIRESVLSAEALHE